MTTYYTDPVSTQHSVSGLTARWHSCSKQELQTLDVNGVGHAESFAAWNKVTAHSCWAIYYARACVVPLAISTHLENGGLGRMGCLCRTAIKRGRTVQKLLKR